ncbi:MAG: S24 family peptidase [Sphingomonas sp.]
MNLITAEISEYRRPKSRWHSCRLMANARNTIYELLLSVKPDTLTEGAWTSRAGVSRSFFTDLKNGSIPRTNTLEKVLSAIGMTPAQFYDLDGARKALPPDSTATRNLPFTTATESMDLPLMGTAQASDMELEHNGAIQFVERMDLDMSTVVEYLRRPPALAGRDDVYAITVIGDSCAPRYEDGDPAYVEARRQPRPGDYVVVQLVQRDDNGHGRLSIALLKQLVRKTSTYVELCQTNPQLSFTIPLTNVHAIHRVKPWKEIVFW